MFAELGGDLTVSDQALFDLLDQVIYNEGAISDPNPFGVLVMGTPYPPAIPIGDVEPRPLQTDTQGRLVLAPGSVPSGNVTIVGPLDGSGNVKVAVEASVLPTGAATAALQSSVQAVPGAAVPADALFVGGTDGTDLRALSVDTSGRLILAPGSIASSVTIAGPLDGSGNVKVAVESSALPTGAATAANQTAVIAATGAAVPVDAIFVAGTDGTDLRGLSVDASGRLILAPGSIASSVTIAGPLDGSGNVKVAVESSALPTGAATAANQTAVIAATGAAVPVDAIFVAGTDGTDLRGLSVDASGRLILAPGSIASSVTIAGPLDGSGNVKVAVESSALPTGAATAANQTAGPGAPSNANTAGTATSLQVKASAGTLYGLAGYSPISQYVQLLDANALASGVTVPVLPVFLLGAGSFALDYGERGRAFATGIFAAFSSTESVFTTGTAGWLDAQFA